MLQAVSTHNRCAQHVPKRAGAHVCLCFVCNKMNTHAFGPIRVTTMDGQPPIPQQWVGVYNG